MRKGFTLIEVSVVLVIMALIVATVIGGRSLSEAAKIQRIITDAREHIMSTNIFKLEFGYFPGDFLHGFDTFANGSNGICGDNSTNHSGCNGDGNGLYYQPEGILAWTHLQLAEIADYRLPLYSTPGTGSRYYRPSPADQYQTWTKNHYNVPQWNDGTINDGWMFVSNQFTNDSQWYGKNGNWLQLGSYSGGPANGWFDLVGAALTIHQASAIDKKIDDGDPVTGEVTALSAGSFKDVNPVSPTCITGGPIIMSYSERHLPATYPPNEFLYNYNESNEVACVLHFYMGDRH